MLKRSLLLTALLGLVQAQNDSKPGEWTLATSPPRNIMNDWFYWRDEDPTHTFVNYLPEDQAIPAGLVKIEDGKLIVAADSTNKVPKLPKGQNLTDKNAVDPRRGRNSVRLQSTNTYGADEEDILMMFDVYHLPVGNGSWPAIWLNGADGNDWPNWGELDIAEGRGGHTGQNKVTFHTGKSRTGGPERCNVTFPGQTDSVKCDGGGGCGVGVPGQDSWGPGFNNAQGGQYVYHRSWTEGALRVYFIPRANVKDFEWSDKLTADDLSTKLKDYVIAEFLSGDLCKINDFYREQIILINIAFCSGYGAADFNKDVEACNAHVADYPERYKETYFSIGGIKVYK